MHEVARHQRSLDGRDEQRHGHGNRHGKVEAGDRHRDDGQDHERDEDGDVDPDVFVDVSCVVARHGVAAWSLVMDAAYRRYSVGKRKIQTRSTKCQKRPECSTRLVNHTGFVFQSFAPGPQK